MGFACIPRAIIRTSRIDTRNRIRSRFVARPILMTAQGLLCSRSGIELPGVSDLEFAGVTEPEVCVRPLRCMRLTVMQRMRYMGRRHRLWFTGRCQTETHTKAAHSLRHLWP
jgi:hypothetical protein